MVAYFKYVAVLQPEPGGRAPNPGCLPSPAAPSSASQPDLPLCSNGMGRASGPEWSHWEVHREMVRFIFVRRSDNLNSCHCLPAVSYIWGHLAPSPFSLYPSPVLRGQERYASLEKGSITMWQVSSSSDDDIWHTTHQQRHQQNSCQLFTQNTALKNNLTWLLNSFYNI